MATAFRKTERSPHSRGLDVAAAAATLLGGLAAYAVVAGCVAFALAGAERPSFLSPPTIHGDPGWLAGPLAGRWPALPTAIATREWGASLVLLGMTACWLLVVACARRIGLAAVVVAALAAVTVLTLAPPFSLTDTFNYLHYGRMEALYGLNPYTHVPVDASGDPAYRWTTWHHLRSPYGPLFTLAMAALAPLGVPTAYWTLKIALALSAVAVMALVAALARRTGREPATAVAFVMLNPLVLVYGIGGVHNDMFVLALLLGGMLLALTRGAVLGGSAWVAAVAIKLSAGLTIPFLLAGARRPLRAAAGVALGALGAAAIVVFAFGGHLPNDAQQSQLVVALSPANLLGLALGRGGLDPALRHDLLAVLALGTAGLAAWTWRTRDWASGAAWASGLLLVTLGWVVPWYVLWLLPWAALAPRSAPRWLAVALTVYLLLIWVPASTLALDSLGWQLPATPTSRANTEFLLELLQ